MPPYTWERYAQVFPYLWTASAFKGIIIMVIIIIIIVIITVTYLKFGVDVGQYWYL